MIILQGNEGRQCPAPHKSRSLGQSRSGCPRYVAAMYAIYVCNREEKKVEVWKKPTSFAIPRSHIAIDIHGHVRVMQSHLTHSMDHFCPKPCVFELFSSPLPGIYPTFNPKGRGTLGICTGSIPTITESNFNQPDFEFSTCNHAPELEASILNLNVGLLVLNRPI